MLKIAGKGVDGFDTYRSKSSAYNEALCVVPRREMPWKSFSDRSQIAKGSIAMANKRGDNGHPCLVPLWRRKGGDSISFVCTDALGEEYKSFTQTIKFSSKPGLEMRLKSGQIGF